MKKFVFILVIMFIVQMAFADEADTANMLILEISTLPEARIGFGRSYTIPFLQGDSPLTEDNNINLTFGARAAPISLHAFAEAIWTPAAFFQLMAGGRIGSGWNIVFLGGDINGIGLNLPDAEGKSYRDGSGFDGLFWGANAGAVLQADLAAFFPGDWNHVVFRTHHEINHRGYSRAKNGEAWYFDNDDGENVNGFNYYGNYLIGYQMPIILNMVAFLAEAELYLYDTPGRSVWGDDRIYWTFSNILNFGITENFSCAIITQLHTQRNYKEANADELYYRNRTLDTSNPFRLEFYRVAAALTYKF